MKMEDYLNEYITYHNKTLSKLTKLINKLTEELELVLNKIKK